MERAFASDKPAVIEVVVNQEYPYSADKAAGWWDAPILSRGSYPPTRDGQYLSECR